MSYSYLSSVLGIPVHNIIVQNVFRFPGFADSSEDPSIHAYTSGAP